MSLVSCHIVGMAFKAEVFYLPNAGGPVGAEYQAENLGNEIIEFPAVLSVGKIHAISAA
jgi:hypothetical protein